jgi:hypothetical protein
MAWTTPGTATAGDVLTAAFWNANVRDNLNVLAPLSAAWTEYTPSWTNLTVGNASQGSTYLQIGKTVIYSGRLDWGSTTSATASDTIVSLPVTASATRFNTYRGSIYMTDSGIRAWVGICYLTSATGLAFAHTESGNFGGVNSLNPFTWGTNDALTWTITYQAA